MNRVEQAYLSRNKRRPIQRELEEVNHELRVVVDSFLAEMDSMKNIDQYRKLIDRYERDWEQRIHFLNQRFVLLRANKKAFRIRLHSLTDKVLKNKNSEYYSEARILRKALRQPWKFRILNFFNLSK